MDSVTYHGSQLTMSFQGHTWLGLQEKRPTYPAENNDMRSVQPGWTLIVTRIQGDLSNLDDEDFSQNRISCPESLLKVPLEDEDPVLGLGRYLVAS